MDVSYIDNTIMARLCSDKCVYVGDVCGLGEQKVSYYFFGDLGLIIVSHSQFFTFSLVVELKNLVKLENFEQTVAIFKSQRHKME